MTASMPLPSPKVTAFFDEATNTISYVVRDPEGSACAIVDSVLDFDYSSGRTDTKSADEIIAFIEREGLQVQWILESHVHADHLSAAPYLQERLGGSLEHNVFHSHVVSQVDHVPFPELDPLRHVGVEDAHELSECRMLLPLEV